MVTGHSTNQSHHLSFITKFYFMKTSDSLTDAQLDRLDTCEQLLGYCFEDKSLLHEAITHSSCADSRLSSYERLEFLGDSILGYITCEYLFQRFPDWLEGQLTQVKSLVVSRQTCGEIGDELRLQDVLNPAVGVRLRFRRTSGG